MSMVMESPGSRQLLPVSCDVVVVGAGLSGALAARRLAEEDLTVAVLEAGEVAGGATGHGGGLALLGVPESYVALSAREGEARARHIWEYTRRNLDILTSLAASVGVAVRQVGSLRPVREGGAAEQLQQTVSLLTEAGFSVRLEDATELDMLVGLRTSDDLAFDPVALTQALLAHPHISVQTNTEVKSIEPEGDGLGVWAKRQYLRTRAVVLAGGAHVVHLNHTLAQGMKVWPVQAVACSCSEAVPIPLVLSEGRVLLQDWDGRQQLTAWSDSPAEEPGSLLAQTAEWFCPQATMREHYSGWFVQSRDGLPLVGELPGLPRVYAVSGLGPWGMSWVFVAVEQLLALMLHNEDPGLLSLKRVWES